MRLGLTLPQTPRQRAGPLDSLLAALAWTLRDLSGEWKGNSVQSRYKEAGTPQ